MDTNPETLPARLREIADAILFGRPSLVARQAADRLEQLERELEQERVIADRLAQAILFNEHEVLAGEDLFWSEDHASALAAWREARRDA
jgi:hypothetical protein